MTEPYAVLVMLGIKRVENRGMTPGTDANFTVISSEKEFGNG